MTRGTIQQENVTPVNIFTTNIGATKHVNQILKHIKGHIDKTTIIVRDFLWSLSSSAILDKYRILVFLAIPYPQSLVYCLIQYKC